MDYFDNNTYLLRRLIIVHDSILEYNANKLNLITWME